MPTMKTASLTRVEDDIALCCHYTPDLSAELKSWIPAQWRAWDYERRFWRFHGSQEPTLRALLHSLGYQVEDGRPENKPSKKSR